MKSITIMAAGTLALIALPALAQVKPLPAEPAKEETTTHLPPPVASDFITRQMETSARILTMQRQKAELDELEELITTVGVDAASRIVPGAADLADSTLGIKARIDEMSHINALGKQISEGRKIMAEINGELPEADEAEDDDSPRNDTRSPRGGEERQANGVMNGPVDLGGDTPVTRDELDRRLASVNRERNTSDVSSAPAISEIYGPDGALTAIVRVGSQEMKVTKGDEIAGAEIVEIRRDEILLKSASGESVLKLR